MTKLIKERMCHISIEAQHKYKQTRTDQQMKVSMALLPKVGKENVPNDDDDDFKPVKKKDIK